LYNNIIISGHGGIAILDTNGRIYLSTRLSFIANGASQTIQPWWYGSYQIDRSFGNVSVIPTPEVTLPSESDPVLKRLLVDKTPKFVEVELTSRVRGDISHFKGDATTATNVAFRLRYKRKDVVSNWETFEIRVRR
jgi:hypothetical protein